MSEEIRRCLRNQAWERAKGELSSMLHTFVGEMGQFEEFKRHTTEFIDLIESRGLQE